MKQILRCNILMVLLLFNKAIGQKTVININPYVSASTSIKEGQLEVGPEFVFKKDSVDIGGIKVSIDGGNSFAIRPSFRIPLTNKDNNIVQIDRFTSTWRSILALQYNHYNIADNGLEATHSFAGQFEYGTAQFKYYPTGKKSEENKTRGNSYGGEIRYVGFFTQGCLEKIQISPQIRLRYSYDWKAAKELGVVNPPNSNGVITTTNIVIDEPSVQPTFSPALALQFYPGKGSFSYAPAVYYDMTGEKSQSSPFDYLDRLRLELWAFYYPIVKGSPNIKIGASPFMSIRTKGVDDFNRIEYGGMITIRFNSTILQFF